MEPTIRPASDTDTLGRALEAFSDPAVVLDGDRRIVAANGAFEHAFPCGARGPIGRACHDVFHGRIEPCPDGPEACPLRRLDTERGTARTVHIHASGSDAVHVEVEMRAMTRGPEGRPRYLGVLKPIAVAAASPGGRELAGRSAAFRRMLGAIEVEARRRTPVLVLGEPGTEKDLVARAIHEQSAPAPSPFVTLECSGASAARLSEEILGRPGAPGAAVRAFGGTLFLDDVDALPVEAHAALLALLDSSGSRFRTIAGAARDPRRLAASGAFDPRLAERLTHGTVEVPPLRERASDIPFLVDGLLQRLRVPVRRCRAVSPQAMRLLRAYRFPGNLCELRSIVERACVLADGDTILPEHLPRACRGRFPRPGFGDSRPSSAVRRVRAYRPGRPRGT